MADKPVTREEKYLAYLTGDYTGGLQKPITRTEKYLYELCLKGIGGDISPEEIKNAVNEYLEKNPVKPGATTEQAQQIEQNKTDVTSLKKETSSLKEDLSNKITKFYASNQGEAHITDSDNGKIQDMMIYGKSSQDRTPTLENPVEIKSVVNPTVKVCGKNLLNPLSMKKGQISTDDGKTINEQANYYHSDYIPMIGTSLSLFYESYVRWFLYDKNKNFISFNSINAIGGKTVTISECNYIRIHMSSIKVPDNLMIAYGTDASFEPYRGQTVTLPYTLNAIPVKSGGNVTIDGQQYVSDYVDVERGKVVKRVKVLNISNLDKSKWGFRTDTSEAIGHSTRYYGTSSMLDFDTNINAMSNIAIYGGIGHDAQGTFRLVDAETYLYQFNLDKTKFDKVQDFTDYLASNNVYIQYALKVPQELDLKPEEIVLFKSLSANYPVTNIFINSEQLDGYTVFNYPISMQNGWNYVKQQIGDTRDYIYDMDLQSAEAYVNSEYAVALTELEV